MANWAQKLKLQHLQTLIALGEQGNLTHVARMMNITQPALSKWLSQLEDEIGITLFERHSKGLRPSEGGKLLLQHAQRLINDMERSQYEIARFSCFQIVYSEDVRDSENNRFNCSFHLSAYRTIHQVMKCIGGKSVAHTGNQNTNHYCCYRIKPRKAK